MHTHFLEAAVRGFQRQPLFECAYLSGNLATYALYDNSVAVDMKQQVPIWFKTVDVTTGEAFHSGADKRLFGRSDTEMWALRDVLEKRYTADYIKQDVLREATTLFFDLQMGTTLEHMHWSPMFGQAVYYANVDELWFDEDGKSFVVARSGYFIDHPDGKCESVDIPKEEKVAT